MRFANRMVIRAPLLALLVACSVSDMSSTNSANGLPNASSSSAKGSTGSGSPGSSSPSSGANDYAVGGTVSGMLGTGLTLALNGGSGLSVAANGTFTFAATLQSGGSYSVTITSQPSSPSQTCVLSGATGTAGPPSSTSVIVTCTNPPSQFAYAGGQAGIYCFAVDAISGVLVPLATPLCDNGGIRGAVAVDPSGPFLYAVEQPSGTPPPDMIPNGAILMYGIDPNSGSLTPLAATQVPAQVNPVALIVDPSGHFVYATNYASDSISAYVINPSTGILTPMAGSPFPTGEAPNALAIDPTGRFLYTANQGSDDVSAFMINTGTGTLTSVPGSPFAVSGVASSVVVDPLSRFVFVLANPPYLPENSPNVFGFQINRVTGALSPVPGSPFAAGNQATGVAVDAIGAFLYVTNGMCWPFAIVNSNGCDTLSGYAISPSTGALTELAGFPIALPAQPLAATVQGDVLYVPTEGVNDAPGPLLMYDINESTGALTQIGGSLLTQVAGFSFFP